MSQERTIRLNGKRHVKNIMLELRSYMSLRTVEAMSGVSNAYLSQLESGKVKNPSIAVLSKLAEFYDVTFTIEPTSK